MTTGARISARAAELRSELQNASICGPLPWDRAIFVHLPASLDRDRHMALRGMLMRCFEASISLVLFVGPAVTPAGFVGDYSEYLLTSSYFSSDSDVPRRLFCAAEDREARLAAMSLCELGGVFASSSASESEGENDALCAALLLCGTASGARYHLEASADSMTRDGRVRLWQNDLPPVWASSRVKVVVARYDEDVSWTAVLVDARVYDVRVYDKGGEGGGELPNVGRESHTYVHHIVENWDRLDDVTVFLQGHPFDHARGLPLPVFLADVVAQARARGFSQNHSVLPEHAARASEGVDPYPLTVQRFFEEVAGVRFHPHIRWYAGAQFAATRDAVRSVPIELWKALLASLTYSSNPITGHYMERLWYEIFCSGGGKPPPEQKRGASGGACRRGGPSPGAGVGWDRGAQLIHCPGKSLCCHSESMA